MIAKDIEMNPWSTKPSKDQNFEKNPDKGGIPAKENKSSENKMLNHKFLDPEEAQLTIYFQWPSLDPAITNDIKKEKRQSDIREYKVR